MNQKKTCGSMYKAGLETYAHNEDEVRIFAAGFVTGQAEKVYLGACRAAMFRPSEDRRAMLISIVQDVCSRYDLVYVGHVGSNYEIWICRREWMFEIVRMGDLKENSPMWHAKRAFLCGIPDMEVDEQFHLREGHGQRCD